MTNDERETTARSITASSKENDEMTNRYSGMARQLIADAHFVRDGHPECDLTDEEVANATIPGFDFNPVTGEYTAQACDCGKGEWCPQFGTAFNAGLDR